MIVADAVDQDEHATDAASPAGTQRLDKWLWFVRVIKTRSAAQRLIADGAVRVNRNRVDKMSHNLKCGDVITITLDRRVRVLKMVAPGVRRGSATDAQVLYEDLTPPPDSQPPDAGQPQAHPMSTQGRPNKRDRRKIGQLKDRWEAN